MPKPNSKSRQELRSRFVRNAIPTETDFADLIAASLNQADDGVLKLPDQPLGLVRQKPDQPVLRFFADPAAEGSVWQVQLGAGDNPGFGLAAADGKLALFVDGATGNVGIGTDSLAAKLHIYHANQDPNGGALILGPISQSNLRLGYNQGYSWIQSHGSKPLSINAIGNNVGIGTVNPGNKLTIQGVFNQYRDPESGISNGGLLALKGNAPQIDFIDTEHGDWAIHVNDGRMYFIREPWEHQDLVLDGKGNIGIGSSVPQAKLNIREITGTPATALKGTLLLDHEDAGGASSIVFSSRVNRGSDYAFIEFRDKNPLINDIEAALLTIGMQNDALDHIALMPSGNVGIGTTTPGFKLDVNGPVRLGGFTSEEKEEWPNIVWCRDLDKGWDEGLIKHGKNFGFFGRAGFGIHIHESRSFELFSTGWRPLLGIEGGSGNTSIRGNVKVNGCITPSAGISESTGILFPKDPGGGSDDAAWLRYYPYSGEDCVLEIGIANDPGDFIYLKSSGGVKIDVLRLGDKWRLSGVGDHEADDDWLRMKNIANTAYYGGLAASKFWTVQGQYTQSDLRSKDNIKNLNSSLENLVNLQGVSFTWKDNPVRFDDNDCESLGLIAQDVEKVFPQLVKSGPDGKLGVNYIGLIPVLVECIKEQQVQMESLRDQLINHL